jgi:hypothetical protein
MGSKSSVQTLRRSDLGPRPTQVGTLSEAGIDKHLADRALSSVH